MGTSKREREERQKSSERKSYQQTHRRRVREVGQSQREAQGPHETEIQNQKDVSRRQRLDGMGMGPWQAERKRLRGERPTARSRAGHQVPGWRKQGGDVPGVPRRSETTSESRSAPQDPRILEWGVRVIYVPGRGEKRLRGMEVGEMEGAGQAPGGGGLFAGPGSRGT